MELCYKPLYNAPPELLKITFQNARSLHKHYNCMKKDHNIIASNVIAVAETRFAPYDTDRAYHINNFTMLRNDEHANNDNLRPPHGQAMYVDHNCTVMDVKTYTSSKYECMVVTINFRPTSEVIQIMSIYKAPTCSMQQFKQETIAHIVPIVDKNIPLIILGDFNLDLQQPNGQKVFLAYFEDLFACNHQSTKSTTVYETTLDLVFTNNYLHVHNIDSIFCPWSDHKSIQLTASSTIL